VKRRIFIYFLVLCALFLYSSNFNDVIVNWVSGDLWAGIQVQAFADEGSGSFLKIPEPATMLLLGAALIGMAGIGRRMFFKK
jgi:hypothetical protein